MGHASKRSDLVEAMQDVLGGVGDDIPLGENLLSVRDLFSPEARFLAFSNDASGMSEADLLNWQSSSFFDEDGPVAQAANLMQKIGLGTDSEASFSVLDEKLTAHGIQQLKGRLRRAILKDPVKMAEELASSTTDAQRSQLREWLGEPAVEGKKDQLEKWFDRVEQQPAPETKTYARTVLAIAHGPEDAQRRFLFVVGEGESLERTKKHYSAKWLDLPRVDMVWSDNLLSVPAHSEAAHKLDALTPTHQPTAKVEAVQHARMDTRETAGMLGFGT